MIEINDFQFQEKNDFGLSQNHLIIVGVFLYLFSKLAIVNPFHSKLIFQNLI
jgi:hypothetical protein